MEFGPVEAVTFDVWNTLISRPDSGVVAAERAAAIAAVLTEVGQHRPLELIEQTVSDARARWEHEWVAGRVFGAREAVTSVLSGLRVELTDSVVGHMASQLDWAGARGEVTTAPGAAHALARLSGEGVRLGIISDTGWTGGLVVRTILDREGLLPLFDHWSFSDEVGVCKPDAGIFDHALAGLGSPDPSRMVHVGDLRRTDVRGARSAGWSTVRFTGFTDDRSTLADADIVVAEHESVAAAILGTS